jgi:hypothetical protein
MSPRDRICNPVEIDDLLSAEFPNTNDPLLRELVLKWMIHNPRMLNKTTISNFDRKTLGANGRGRGASLPSNLFGHLKRALELLISV